MLLKFLPITMAHDTIYQAYSSINLVSNISQNFYPHPYLTMPLHPSYTPEN